MSGKKRSKEEEEELQDILDSSDSELLLCPVLPLPLPQNLTLPLPLPLSPPPVPTRRERLVMPQAPTNFPSPPLPQDMVAHIVENPLFERAVNYLWSIKNICETHTTYADRIKCINESYQEIKDDYKLKTFEKTFLHTSLNSYKKKVIALKSTDDAMPKRTTSRRGGNKRTSRRHKTKRTKRNKKQKRKQTNKRKKQHRRRRKTRRN